MSPSTRARFPSTKKVACAPFACSASRIVPSLSRDGPSSNVSATAFAFGTGVGVGVGSSTAGDSAAAFCFCKSASSACFCCLWFCTVDTIFTPVNTKTSTTATAIDPFNNMVNFSDCRRFHCLFLYSRLPLIKNRLHSLHFPVLLLTVLV